MTHQDSNFIKIFIWLAIITPSLTLAAPSNYVRLPLSQSSTEEKPSYFYCTVTPNPYYPTTRKFELDTIKVIMVNYGQMTRQFNGLGMLEATAQYVNQYAFATYHDSRPIYKNKPGFVDVFVTWPAYQINCQSGSGNRPLTPTYG